MFYHGTSSNIQIDKFLLPSTQTNNLRENRTKNKEFVFLTKSMVSANRYACKACFKYGGVPIIYKAIPQGYYFETHNAEVMCYKAKIIQ